MRAMRRDPAAAERFPQDVQELQGYLSNESRVPGVVATPGSGTEVPLYILGSSLFGAQLAAALGLPFAFASHFAPDALEQAVEIYRREFRPSEQSQTPHVIAGVNVIAADTDEQAQQQFLATKRSRVRLLLGRGRKFTDEEADLILDAPQGRQILQMTKYSAVGTPSAVKDYLERFTRHADADELIVASGSGDRRSWLRSYELLAEVTDLRNRTHAGTPA